MKEKIEWMHFLLVYNQGKYIWPKTNIIKISQTLQLFCKKKQTYLIKNFMQNN